ncbi:sensor histidine kinase [Paractinoplanes atraurantiacus]|uniref:histidine kinase n=1 Tax=Paractinoplanes atraurantiacus TaxID=1036182 RepID=A0A285HN24_9ACTN|nr:histidine kinase [Actinoplanes atraurantiacus]SNY37132.1 Signal transduction histidine kinase [Actinoplanes atraurantiacus]
MKWWRARPAWVRDGIGGLLLLALAFVPPLTAAGTRLGELPRRPADVLAVLAAVAMTVPLAARRRWPAVVLAVVGAGFAVQELRGYQSAAGAGLLVALYSAGVHQERFRREVGAAAVVAYVSLCVALHAAGSAARVQDHVIFFALVALTAVAGAVVRRRRAADREQARVAERVRIARELHDVVTHHVTAIVVQANATRFVAGPGPAADSLEVIADTGKRALTELRDLLGVLDPERPAPRDRLPGLAQVGELVASTRAAGQPVTLVEDGTAPDMGAGRELAAYRVVQEALTNAMKYAAGQTTAIELDYQPDGVTVTVITERAASGGAGGGSGHGLAGLRERVELFGGEMTAGPRPGGGFAVRAHVPLEGAP